MSRAATAVPPTSSTRATPASVGPESRRAAVQGGGSRGTATIPTTAPFSMTSENSGCDGPEDRSDGRNPGRPPNPRPKPSPGPRSFPRAPDPAEPRPNDPLRPPLRGPSPNPRESSLLSSGERPRKNSRALAIRSKFGGGGTRSLRIVRPSDIATTNPREERENRPLFKNSARSVPGRSASSVDTS